MKNKRTEALEATLQAYGKIAAPIMEALPNQVKQLQSAMLCTIEGFNVCAIGFEEDKITKMAAVSSSLCAMSASVVSAFSEKRESELNTVSIDSDLVNILGKRINLPDDKPLILLIAFQKGTKLGIQQYAAQHMEEQLCKAIAEKQPSST